MGESELIYRRWIEEVWNNGREETIAELFDEDGVVYYPNIAKSDEPVRGTDQIKEVIQIIREKFSNLKVEISDIVVEFDKLIVFCRIEALYRKSYSENYFDNSLESTSLCQVKFRNGKIAEIWSNVTFGSKEPLF